MILVTGASGLLGQALARELARRGRTGVGTSRDGARLPAGLEPRALTLDDGGAAAAALVRALRPAAVLHVAAMADADACARDPAAAARVNRDATGALARAAVEVGARVVYTSSDLVFDGTRAPYGEDDPVAPLGPYMATKAEGEALARAAGPGVLVARVALLYGRATGERQRPTFADTLAARLARGEQVPCFADQWRTPVQVDDAAGLLLDLLDRGAEGTVHVAGPERVSRLELARAIARALGLDPAGCRPVRAEDVPGLAPRPPDASLRDDRLRALLGRGGLGVEDGCARLRR